MPPTFDLVESTSEVSPNSKQLLQNVQEYFTKSGKREFAIGPSIRVAATTSKTDVESIPTVPLEEYLLANKNSGTGESNAPISGGQGAEISGPCELAVKAWLAMRRYKTDQVIHIKYVRMLLPT
jgi:hypothetical protein